MPPARASERLQEQLNRLAASGARRLRRWALRCACDRHLRLLFPAAACVSGAILIAALLDAGAGLGAWPFGLFMTIAVALALPALVVAGCVLTEFLRHRADRRMCLALYDRELGLKDRLQAADQYLGKANRSDFEEAAVEDARGYAKTALARQLPPIAIRPPDWVPPHRRLGALAAVLLAAALWVGQYSASQAAIDETAPANAAPGALRENPDLAQILPDPMRPRPASLEARRNTEAEAPRPEENSSQGELDTQEFSSQRQSTDRGAAGSDARRSNRSRQAQSGASGQQAEKQEQDDSESKKQASKKKPRESGEEPPDQRREAAGLKGGKGDMSGGRMAASDHASAQDKTQQPEPEGDSDDGDEEEDEEQKAGSASKPLINQRKAPVNRSLTPSADGGEERDDLNGRGGPGGLKKTRGVAAMLLGVPLPDYLQGKVNPGRMKIQSEQGRAEERQAGLAQARERPARDAAVGHTLHREIPPSGRAAVRNYFVAQRTNNGDAPEEQQ